MNKNSYQLCRFLSQFSYVLKMLAGAAPSCFSGCCALPPLVFYTLFSSRDQFPAVEWFGGDGNSDCTPSCTPSALGCRSQSLVT